MPNRSEASIALRRRHHLNAVVFLAWIQSVSLISNVEPPKDYSRVLDPDLES
jgi:hypothetical protein